MSYKDVKNEQAIEMLAEIIDPAVEIFSDEAVVKEFRLGNNMGGIKIILKNHSKAILEILARFDGVEPDEYECNVLTLPARLLEFFNDPDMMVLFQSQGQKTGVNFSGSATESTAVEEK